MKKSLKRLFPLLLSGFLLTGCGAQGPKGEQGPQGEQGPAGNNGTNGQSGQDGVSIVSITKTSSDGLIDTYTIEFSNQTSETFQVTNGKDGVSTYNLYCNEHPEYEGSLQDWLNLFYKKDETDYTKYDDFLFTEVTYNGQLGYAANYIGTSGTINFPEAFRNLPVLLATIEDSVFAPQHDEITHLGVVRFPSTVKVISISDSMLSRYDTTNVNAYFEGGLDRFDAPFYPKKVYFAGDSLETYRATNLRKYFSFSNVYTKTGEQSYTQVVNGSDNARDFVNTHVLNEGGIRDQIYDLLGGTNELVRFGSFELKFPSKYTANFDGYDIELPLNLVDFYGDLKKSSGITFENSLLKGNAGQYSKTANKMTLEIDLGIPSWPSLGNVIFSLYKEPTKIKIGETGTLINLDLTNVFGNNDMNFPKGKAQVVAYYHDDPINAKIPLKCKTGTEIEIDIESSVTSINFKEEGSFDIGIDLNTFELQITPTNFNKKVNNELLSAFCNDNGFVLKGDDEYKVVVLDSKELTLPASRQIECSGIKYNVDLTYRIEPSSCVENADTDHPTIFYNYEIDKSEEGFIEIPVEIRFLIGGSYETGNALIRGYFTVYVKIYDFHQGPKLGLNMHISKEQTKSKELMFDLNELGQSRRIYRLNEVSIDCKNFALAINNYEVIYKLAEGSLGEVKDGYYEITSGLYNLTLDLDNQTLNIEEASGELTESVKVGFFKHLKEEGFNVYVRDSNYIVLFDNIKDRTVDHEFNFTDNDSREIGVVAQIKKASYCTIIENFVEEDGEQVNKDCELKVNFTFNGFDDRSEDRGFNVSFKSEAYFLDVENAFFNCIYRKCPTTEEDFHFEDAEPVETIIVDNVFYLNGVYLNNYTYRLYLRGFNPDDSVPPQLIGGEGTPFSLRYDLVLGVPEDAFGHYYDLVFDFNNYTVTITNSDKTYA